MKLKILLFALYLVNFTVNAESSKITGSNIYQMNGDCQSLVVSDNDWTENCDSKIVQSTHSNGRIGFTVLIGDKGTVATFSGMDGQNIDENTDVIVLDKFIFNLNIEGIKPTNETILGKCVYTNPYNGRAKVECLATNVDGKKYSVNFLSDGKDPRPTVIK